MTDPRVHADALLAEVLARRTTWLGKPGAIEIPTLHGERRQVVHAGLDGGHWELWSVVLPAEHVTRSGRIPPELALRAWARNDAANLTTFAFDSESRLIGRIRHPAGSLNAETLELLLAVLAAECDRFEFLLAGRDVS